MMEINRMYRSCLKNRILVQGLLPRTAGQERRAEVQFEMASNKREGNNAAGHYSYPVLRRMLVRILPFFQKR
jgi:hypothetical protein